MPQTVLHEKENQSVVYKVPAKNIETEIEIKFKSL